MSSCRPPYCEAALRKLTASVHSPFVEADVAFMPNEEERYEYLLNPEGTALAAPRIPAAFTLLLT